MSRPFTPAQEARIRVLIAEERTSSMRNALVALGAGRRGAATGADLAQCIAAAEATLRKQGR